MNRLSPRLATYAPRGAVAVNPKALGVDFAIFNPAAKLFEESDDSAIVAINGPLVHHATWCFDSYDSICERLTAAVDSSASRILLRIDSPGGDVSGCFELARAIREMSSRKPIVAFIEGQGCSAAYALACACTAVYASATSDVGSIGVIEMMVDATAQDAALGLRFVFARSGARKGDGNPHLPLDKEAFEARQQHCDSLAAIFFEHVAEMRGVSSEEVQALQAGVFLGAEALSRRLIDGVTSWSELVSGTQGVEGGKPMAKKLTEYLAALADGEDKEEAKKAKKALAALIAEDEPAEDEGGEKKEAVAAKAEDAPADDKKEAVAAKAEDDDKKKDEMKAAASAALPQVAALAREVHTLRAERAAEVDGRTRAAIFATRPDLGAETVKALAAVPTAALQSIVDTFPKIPTGAIAAMAIGTVGDTQGAGGAASVPAHIVDAIDLKMGLSKVMAAVKNVGNELHLGPLSPAEARTHLATLNGGK